jgi:hypothetical protein
VDLLSKPVMNCTENAGGGCAISRYTDLHVTMNASAQVK